MPEAQSVVVSRVQPAGSGPAKATVARASNNFDFLRLIAASAVIVQHSTQLLMLPFLWVVPKSPWWFYDGVPLFFAMSGMLVYRSCARCIDTNRPIKQYYVNRYLRIAPALYVYAALTALVLGALGILAWSAMASPSFAVWVATNLAFVPIYHPALFSGFGTGVLNGSLWTIPVEVSFYVALPAIILLERRFGFKPVMAVAFAGVFAVSAIAWWMPSVSDAIAATVPLSGALLDVTTASSFYFFLFGMIAAQAWHRIPQSGWLALAGLVAYGFVRIDPLSIRAELGAFWPILWGIPLVYAALWFAHHGPQAFAKVTRIGDLSFGVYIWHYVVINMVAHYGLHESGMASLAVHGIVIASTFALAALSWWLVEKPALRLKPFTSREKADG